ncbi:MAG: SGNH/GDSL hydrolase family protein [Planctomycetes bacterium]|nr:SGNH/GDSL hydrolase family protein [Planctomycetota bacterium]
MTDAPHTSTSEETSDEPRSTPRALRACLVVCFGYALLVPAGLLVRVEIHRWGLLLSPWQFDELWFAMACHLAAVVVFGVLLFMLRRRSHVSVRWGRWGLAIMPFLLLVSTDLIASVGYRPIRPRMEMMKTHPIRFWEYRPGWIRRHRGVTYRINEHGLRGPLVPFEKKPGERRILFLGDSIAFGLTTNEEDCFVWQLRDLARKHSGGGPISVVNCSVSGYSPWQEYDILKTQGLRYDPDVVVHVFCLNDIGQKFNLVNYGGRTKDLAPPEPAALEWSGLFRMSRALAFQRFGPTRAELRARDEAYSSDAVIDQSTAPHIQEAWRITCENLGRIASLVRERNIPLLIVGVPMARQIDPTAPDSSPPQQWLAEYGREEKVPILDLLPIYRKHARENGMTGRDLFPDKTHPTKVGNRIAADAIYEFLTELGWLE